MLLIIVTFLVLVIGVLISIAGGRMRDGLDDIVIGAGCAVFVLSGIVLFLEIIVAIVCNVGTEGMIAKKEQVYNSLVYQMENDLYDNDNDLGKKELYNQIQDWNTDLAEGKSMQRNLWVGVFYPNIYDEFDYIELGVSE